MIKPSSSLCNMQCSYCFYEDVSKNRENKSLGLMSAVSIESLVNNLKLHKHLQEVNIVFQGGEPLLVGISFYYNFFAKLRKELNKIKINYSIQTNGTLIDDEYCILFKENDVLIGISIDGYEEVHDNQRSMSNTVTHNKVMKSLKMLENYRLDYNVVTVLTKNLENNASKLYDFYRKNSIDYIHIIPCMADMNQNVYTSKHAVTPEGYSKFFLEIFDYFIEDLKRGKYRSIDLIEEIIFTLQGYRSNKCGFHGFCESQCVIEADGSVYPCDFYVIDEYYGGNINSESLVDIYNSDIMQNFEKEGNTVLPSPCEKCMYKVICNGGCKRLRPSYVSENYCGLKDVYDKVNINMYKIKLLIDDIQENKT